MSAKRIALVREAAAATVAGYEKFAVQAARRIVRLQDKRRRLRRELRVVEEELRLRKREMRAVMRAGADRNPLDTPMPVAEPAS